MANKNVGMVLTITGGVFYVVGAYVGAFSLFGILVGITAFSSAKASNSTFSTSVPLPASLGQLWTLLVIVIAFGMSTGAMMVVGGVLLGSDSKGRRNSGGILAAAMMVIGALPTLGGIGIGFVLALLGVILGLTYEGNGPDVVKGVQPVPPPQAALTGRAQAAARSCVKCGSPLRDGANFCVACGAQTQKA